MLMKATARRAQRGVTLIELMISIAIGLFVAAVAVTMIVNSNKTNLDTLKMVRLNQELRSIMSLMERDIRRNGFSAEASDHVNATGFSGQGTAANFAGNDVNGNAYFSVNAAGNCATYGYDQNFNRSDDTATTPVERFGFGLDADTVTASHAVTRRATDTPCTATGSGTGWVSISDANSVNITALQFADVNSPNPNLPICIGTGIGLYVRAIEVTLSGRLVSDPTVTRTISETIRLRNDEMSYAVPVATCP